MIADARKATQKEAKDGRKKKEVTFDRNSMLRAEKINDDVWPEGFFKTRQKIKIRKIKCRQGELRDSRETHDTRSQYHCRRVARVNRGRVEKQVTPSQYHRRQLARVN